MNYRDYFAQIMALAILTEEDRQLLREKRGFSDAIIDKLQFKSCGPELKALLPIDTPHEILDSLSQKNILIPYLGSNGEILHLRPHKFGFKDAGIQVYIPSPLLEGKDLKRIVIAESEFKAAASCMMGVPAIGIPGIGSFSKTKLPQLIEVLKSLQSKEVIMCFDNEEKSDPKFANFKPDWTKRYDTFIYEYIMAIVIQREGFKTRIARLRDDWRVDGKADIDGILAQLVPPHQYKAVIDEAVDPQTYRKAWRFPRAHQQYIDRKIDRHFYSKKIFKEFGALYTGKAPNQKKITNFTAEIINTMISQNGFERFVKLTDSYGHECLRVVTPELMVSKAAFQKFLYECGDFQFYGKDDQLTDLWEYIILHQDGRYITKLKHYGYDEESGVWFFGNGAYFNGEYFPAGEDGIYWIGDIGYKLPESLVDFELPILSDEKNDVNLASIFVHLKNILGDNEAKVILGWTIGNFFMPEILKEFKNYPFLFFHGKYEEGKSTISNWLTSFFGYTKKGVPFAGSTMVGIRNVISQLSMIPTWLEEYRNQDPQLIQKNNLLRSVYDRSTIVKGSRTPDQIKTNTLRSSLIISGEEHPVDAALLSRCLLIGLNTKKDKENYNWMMSHQAAFNCVGHHLLTNKNIYWPNIRERIKQYLSAFDTVDVTTRSKTMYSMVAGIWDAVMGEEETFTEYIGNITVAESKKVSSSSGLNIFLEDIADMRNTGKITFDFVKRVRIQLSNKTYKEACFFWFSGAYSHWELYLKKMRPEIPASRNALMDMVYREPYFIKRDYPVRINQHTQRGLLLDPNHAKFPRCLEELLKQQDADPTNFGDIIFSEKEELDDKFS